MTYRSDQVEFEDKQRLKMKFRHVLIDVQVICNREITFSERYLADTFNVEDICGTLDPTIIYNNYVTAAVQVG